MSVRAVLALAAVAVLAACPPEPAPTDDDDAALDDDDMYEELGIPDDRGMAVPFLGEEPTLSVFPARPHSEMEVAMVLDLEGAVSATLDVSGPGCGGFRPLSGELPLEQTALAGAQGECFFSALITTPDEDLIEEARFVVQPLEPDVPDVGVVGGILRYDAFPEPSPDAPPLTTLTVPELVDVREPVVVSFDRDEAADARGVLVAVDGYDAWWYLPIEDPTLWDASVELELDPELLNRLGERLNVQIQVALLVGVGSLVTPPLSRALSVGGVPGEVGVVVEWGTNADIDLVVIGPDGERVSIAGSNGPGTHSGDQGCTGSAPYTETISWAPGVSLPGVYDVEVQVTNDCDYFFTPVTLSMVFCGAGSPTVEQLELGVTGGIHRTSFTSDCEATVSGRVRYQDFPVTTGGWGASNMLPARNVDVEAVRGTDGAVLGRATTDAAGDYRIDFFNGGDPAYTVRVVAEHVGPTVSQRVQTNAGSLWVWNSVDTFDSSANPVETDVDFEILGVDGAAVLNIFDQGVTLAAYARTLSGRRPSDSTWHWTSGQLANHLNGFGGGGSHYTRDSNLWIRGASTQGEINNGIPNNTDEWDDTVMAHEYGHFVEDDYSIGDSPGGQHFINGYSDPRLAWSEGFATWFGQAALGSPWYLDRAGNVWSVRYNAESGGGMPLGNSPAQLSGQVCEAVVTMILWDLFDTTNEVFDSLQGQTAGIWASFGTYLPGANFADRGVAGRDLVDFVDGLRCLGAIADGTVLDGLTGNVQTRHQMSYDWPVLASCVP